LNIEEVGWKDCTLLQILALWVGWCEFANVCNVRGLPFYAGRQKQNYLESADFLSFKYGAYLQAWLICF
jgi:hypothetical protein